MDGKGERVIIGARKGVTSLAWHFLADSAGHIGYKSLRARAPGEKERQGGERNEMVL